MTNPFLAPWTTPFGVPPFDQIATDHFRPAYDAALAAHRAEIAAIAADPAAPDFDNTVAALERSGTLLRRVDMVFSQLASASTTDEMQAIERDLAPVVARHWNEIYLNAALFARLDTLYTARARLGLSAEQLRVLERYHMDFVRAGARLRDDQRSRFAAIVEQLATLGTRFAQNVLADEQQVFGLTESEVEGLPPAARAAAAELARARGLDAPYAVSTSRSSVEPILHFAHNRAVRERIWRGFVSRGRNGNANDNRQIIAETVALRTELARLLGYDSYAAFKLADTMAGSPAAATALLERLWQPGRARALHERDELQALVAREGGNFTLQPWDWRFYAEKQRVELYDFDETLLKPYLSLDKVLSAAFFTAERLFGVRFVLRPDIPGYHPDVQVYAVHGGPSTAPWNSLTQSQVKNASGDGRENAVPAPGGSGQDAPIGLLYVDAYARPGKRSGAWMTSFREQSRLDGVVIPLIVNTCNFSRPPDGEPCLLSLDEARTVFHEFGHGLHGLLSAVTYPRLSGTSTVRDFVELPSQLYEHWLEEPAVLARLTHYQTGAPIPQALLDRLKAARNANKGFETVEIVSSAILDMAFHQRDADDSIDPDRVEAETLARIDMPEAIVLRHASPHFAHIFAGDGYAAGYYSYLWSEVLDADGFDAFTEAGDPFDPEVAERLYRYVYSAGGTRDFAEAYRLFRGRDPDPQAMLRQRGLEGLAPVDDSVAS